MNGDELQRLATVENEVKNVKEIVTAGFEDMKKDNKEMFGHLRKLHSEHYKTDEEQGKTIVMVEQRIGTLETNQKIHYKGHRYWNRWIIGTLVSACAAGTGLLIKFWPKG